MTYLVVVDTTSDNKIAKMQNYDSRSEADAHVTKVIGKYPNAFVIDNPPPYVMDYTTVDVVAKTLTYDSASYITYQAMEDWKTSIQATDSSMPRHMEDLITSNVSLVVPAEMKKRYDEKIKVRGERP
jgi:hypothetical protein